MKIDIATKNITLDDALEVFIQDRIGSLEKFLGKGTENAEARVEIGKPSRHHKKGLVFYAEANLKVGKQLLRAQAYHNDLRAAIVDVKEGLKVEMTKFTKKRKDLERKSPKK